VNRFFIVCSFLGFQTLPQIDPVCGEQVSGAIGCQTQSLFTGRCLTFFPFCRQGKLELSGFSD
jgi:hypothetical protein